MSQTLSYNTVGLIPKSSTNAASKYKLLRVLKDTLCGKVRLATDAFGNLYAVKVSSRQKLRELIRKNCAENPQEEIRLMTKLRDSPLEGHEYVIKLIDTFVFQKGSEFFDCTVLEFADDGEVFDHIQSLSQQGERLSLPSVRDAFIMIAKGVRFIHMNGIVHLDLSLENILSTKQNVYKICDFGAAKEGRTFKLKTKPGKFPYMAPEVFKNEEFDGQKADVWSIGVIFWTLLTGLALYVVPDDSDARFQRLRNGKSGIKEILTAFKIHGIPEGAIDLLSGMLNVNANERFTIHQVLDHPWLATNTLETKSIRKSELSTDGQLDTTPNIPKIKPNDSGVSCNSNDESQLRHDKKVISPPSDDSYRTYQRLYDLFEAKYGKLIAQQEDQTSGSTGQYPLFHQPVTKPVEYNSSFYSTFFESSDPTNSTSSQSSTQVGWKRTRLT